MVKKAVFDRVSPLFYKGNAVKDRLFNLRVSIFKITTLFFPLMIL